MLRHFLCQISLLSFAVLLTVGSGCATAQPRSEDSAVEMSSIRADKTTGPGQMTRARVQTELMRFADQYVARVTQGFQEFEATAPTTDLWRVVFEDVLFSIHAAYTIAADPSPGIGLLDMVVLVSLGRIVYEEDRLAAYGQPVEPMAHAFRSLEPEVWTMAAKVLSSEQQEDLDVMITEWRKRNPHHQMFSYVRFGDFAGQMSDSSLAQVAASGGLFGTVREATRQIDEVRNLAERGMFLATRMPLLTQAYVELILVQALKKPEIMGLMGNVDKLSGVIEQMPGFLTKERKATVDHVMGEVETLRKATIDHVMTRVSLERKVAIDQAFTNLGKERKALIDQLVSEEQRVRGVLSDLRGTVTAANELAMSANTLTARLIPDLPEGAPRPPSEPLDIKDVRATLVEVTTILQQTDGLVKTIDHLMASPNWDQRVPQLLNVVDRLEAETEEIIDHSFRQAVILILITLTGLLIVLLIYRYVSKTLLEGNRRDHLRDTRT